MLLIVTFVVPTFVIVDDCATLDVPNNVVLKVNLLGESCMAVPMPARGSDCGLPVALSVILTEAIRFPIAVGSKVTLIVQLFPGATLVHVLVCEKSPAFVPEIVTEDTVKVEVPVFVSVAV